MNHPLFPSLLCSVLILWFDRHALNENTSLSRCLRQRKHKSDTREKGWFIGPNHGCSALMIPRSDQSFWWAGRGTPHRHYPSFLPALLLMDAGLFSTSNRFGRLCLKRMPNLRGTVSIQCSYGPIPLSKSRLFELWKWCDCELLRVCRCLWSGAGWTL